MLGYILAKCWFIFSFKTVCYTQLLGEEWGKVHVHFMSLKWCEVLVGVMSYEIQKCWN